MNEYILENKHEQLREYYALEAGRAMYQKTADASRAGAESLQGTIENDVANYFQASDPVTAGILGASIIITGVLEMIATGLSRK